MEEAIRVEGGSWGGWMEEAIRVEGGAVEGGSRDG